MNHIKDPNRGTLRWHVFSRPKIHKETARGYQCAINVCILLYMWRVRASVSHSFASSASTSYGSSIRSSMPWLTWRYRGTAKARAYIQNSCIPRPKSNHTPVSIALMICSAHSYTSLGPMDASSGSMCFTAHGVISPLDMSTHRHP